MADIGRVKTDTKKEVEGIWVDFAEGIRLLIARAGNYKYEQLLSSLTEPHLKKIRAGLYDQEKYDKLVKRARSETILLDWENIEEDGQTVPYSPQKALEWFLDPELKDFYNFVVMKSQDVDSYRKDVEGDSVGNS